MSTRAITYVIIGMKLTFAKYDQRRDEIGEDEIEKFDPDNAHPYDVNIVADGMNGEYAVVGSVLAKSDEYGNLPFVTIENWTPSKIKKLKAEIVKVFPGVDQDIRVHAFTHYT